MTQIDFDFSDLLDGIEEDEMLTEQQVQEVTEKITLDVQRDLIVATPKDTGRASMGWQATLPAQPYATGAVENNVPYIEQLNDGHSPQAAKLFVENVVARYDGDE